KPIVRTRYALTITPLFCILQVVFSGPPKPPCLCPVAPLPASPGTKEEKPAQLGISLRGLRKIFMPVNNPERKPIGRRMPTAQPLASTGKKEKTLSGHPEKVFGNPATAILDYDGYLRCRMPRVCDRRKSSSIRSRSLLRASSRPCPVSHRKNSTQIPKATANTGHGSDIVVAASNAPVLKSKVVQKKINIFIASS